jgi:murein DD-endopeptidase MepM/ murein hydrolase activator NlpD
VWTTLKIYCIAGLLCASAAAAAQEMKEPRVSFARVDWDAALGALTAATPLQSAANVSSGSLPGEIARLNGATTLIFSNIAASPVPVLLPFDIAAYLHDWGEGKADNASKYLSGFHAAVFFYPGASGYDAALSLRPQDVPGLDLTFVNRVDVQISGSALTYELDGPAASQGAPLPELEAEFPGIRRLLLESRLRYTFVRFGVPYVVSVSCFDGPMRVRRLSCREADKVALRFLKALRVAGGAPHPHLQAIKPRAIDRPAQASPTFTYFAPGDLIPGSGMRGNGGRADHTVYARIRFPFAEAPAYANSQSFMHWGDCDRTGRVAMGGRGKNAAYRCRVNSRRLVFDEAANYTYPWRDNFCEHRYFYVGQCPGGLGHQGQDIRPAWCQQRNENADRCLPYQHDVVAVRDGALLRAPGDMALYLVVNKPGEHVRFRYLHMSPRLLDEAGLVSGREVHEGEVIGKVGNFFRRPGGTTYHLHFDVQVPTRQGWVFVNPYMTLVAAYERLIGGRGEMVNDAKFAPPVPSAAATPPAAAEPPSSPADSAAPAPSVEVPAPRLAPASHGAKVTAKKDGKRFGKKARKDKRGRTKLSAGDCKAGFAKGAGRRHCDIGRDKSGAHAKHARSVRSMGRHVSPKGDRARPHGRNLHKGHARTKARHGRV